MRVQTILLLTLPILVLIRFYPNGGYPTFYVICPDRVIGSVDGGYGPTYGNQAYWLNYTNSCPSLVTGLNAQIRPSTTQGIVCPGDVVPIKATIRNAGTVPFTNAVVDAKIGTTTIGTFNWSGSLSRFHEDTLNLGNYTKGSSNVKVDYTITVVGDVHSADDQISKDIYGSLGNKDTITLQVKTDDFPSSNSWELRNSANMIVQQHTYTGNLPFSGGPDALKVFDHPLILNYNECYTLEFVDIYNDGLTVTAPGYVRLYDGHPSNSILIDDFGGDFGSGFITRVKRAGSVSVNDIIDNSSFKVFPNPVSSLLNVDFDLLEVSDVNMQLLDMNGRVILSSDIKNASAIHEQLNVQGLSSGIYNLNIRTPKQSKNVKVNIR